MSQLYGDQEPWLYHGCEAALGYIKQRIFSEDNKVLTLLYKALVRQLSDYCLQLS